MDKDLKNTSKNSLNGRLKISPWYVLILFLIGILWSCYYDSKEFLYPELIVSCDTANVTYSAGVVAILSENCYSCHNAAIQNGNVNLTEYNMVKNLVTEQRNATPVLIGVIGHMSGFSNMPPSGKLSDCNIKIIQNWVESGAPNN